MLELQDVDISDAMIKVFGVGGGGGNAVQHMMKSDVEGVDFICANTDAQALKTYTVPNRLTLGREITNGLGAGANPDIGRQAAEQSEEDIRQSLEGADMIFVTAGMGGGTGTGAAPVVARIAREMGILTVGVVTKPFPFEGTKRMRLAMEGINELGEHVDSLITIPNAKLMEVMGKNASLLDAFSEANNVLLNAVKGISDLITCPGMINVDFADVRTVMTGGGISMMGTGSASGNGRASEAAEKAIASPLLDNLDLTGANGILVNITAGMDFTLGEFDEIGSVVSSYAREDATIVIGTSIDESLESGELKVTLVATGVNQAGPQNSPRQQPGQDQLRGHHRPTTQSRNPAPHQTGNQSRIPSGGNQRPRVFIDDYSEPNIGNLDELDEPDTHHEPHLGSKVQDSTPRGFGRHQSPQSQHRPQSSHKKATKEDEDYLDIPAFLRKQTG